MLRERPGTRSPSQDADSGDNSERRSLGVYYTPPTAAQILARWVIRARTDSVLEPSFGGCALLAAAVERLHALDCAQPAQQLSGFDVDPRALVHLATLLGSEVDDHVQFSRSDFLEADASSAPPVTGVIANPPYVSWHRMSTAQREVVRRWRKRYSPDFPMTASLWAYFLLHASSFLAPGGRLAFVLPASALTSDYGRPVLDFVGRKFQRTLVFHVHEKLFVQAGAQEKTALFLADHLLPTQRLTSPAFVERAVSSLEDLESILVTGRTNAGSAPSIRESAALFLSSLRDRGCLWTLGEVATVAIGEVVGDTRFFAKTSGEWEALGINSQGFRALVTGMRQLTGARLTAREVTSTYSAIPRLITVPRNGSKRLQRYLDTYPSSLRKQNVTFAKRSPWYAVSYDSTSKAFVGSLSHEAPRIVLNTAGVSCANGLYKISASRGIAWRAAIAVAVHSTLTQVSAELHARARGSGALKLEPSDVRRLLVPDYQRLSDAEAKALVNQVDTLLRAGEREAAARLVDHALLIRLRVITAAQLRQLRDQLYSLRRSRMQRN